MRSKNRRIRRKGEKMRAGAWAFKRALWMNVASIRGQTRMVTMQSAKPPGEVSGLSIGGWCRVVEEPGVHPLFGAYDGRVVVDPDARPDYFEVGTARGRSTACACTSTHEGDRVTLTLCESCRLQSIGPRRNPKAWGRIGSTAIGGPAFTKHTRDGGDPDYIAAANGDTLDHFGLDALLAEATDVARMPVVELPEVE